CADQQQEFLSQQVMNGDSARALFQHHVWGARARPPAGRLGVLEWLAARALSSCERTFAIALPEDDRAVVDERRGRRQPVAEILEPGTEPSERLRQSAFRDGPTLRI